MPKKTVHCRICRKAISGSNFAQRMKKVRRHYKEKHPTTWRRSVLKGARKRTKKRRSRRR